jgi:nicotinate-nucleotide pyrophosphorylase
MELGGSGESFVERGVVDLREKGSVSSRRWRNKEKASTNMHDRSREDRVFDGEEAEESVAVVENEGKGIQLTSCERWALSKRERLPPSGDDADRVRRSGQ